MNEKLNTDPQAETSAERNPVDRVHGKPPWTH